VKWQLARKHGKIQTAVEACLSKFLSRTICENRVKEEKKANSEEVKTELQVYVQRKSDNEQNTTNQN
jgi:hypothetical protein